MYLNVITVYADTTSGISWKFATKRCKQSTHDLWHDHNGITLNVMTCTHAYIHTLTHTVRGPERVHWSHVKASSGQNSEMCWLLHGDKNWPIVQVASFHVMASQHLGSLSTSSWHNKRYRTPPTAVLWLPPTHFIKVFQWQAVLTHIHMNVHNGRWLINRGEKKRETEREVHKNDWHVGE